MVPTGLMHGRLSRFSRRSRLASPANLDVCERFDPLQPSYTFVSLVSSKPGRQKVRHAASLVLTPCEYAAVRVTRHRQQSRHGTRLDLLPAAPRYHDVAIAARNIS